MFTQHLHRSLLPKINRLSVFCCILFQFIFWLFFIIMFHEEFFGWAHNVIKAAQKILSVISVECLVLCFQCFYIPLQHDCALFPPHLCLQQVMCFYFYCELTYAPLVCHRMKHIVLIFHHNLLLYHRHFSTRGRFWPYEIRKKSTATPTSVE